MIAFDLTSKTLLDVRYLGSFFMDAGYTDEVFVSYNYSGENISDMRVRNRFTGNQFKNAKRVGDYVVISIEQAEIKMTLADFMQLVADFDKNKNNELFNEIAVKFDFDEDDKEFYTDISN